MCQTQFLEFSFNPASTHLPFSNKPEGLD